MKKLVLGAMIMAMFSACKKETQIVNEEHEIPTDSITVAESNESDATLIPFKEIEFSPEQTAKYIAKQNADTLYITNFFATWCGPCVREIPHFKEKMTEVQNQPVKFTFVSLDQRSDWPTAVKNFSEQHGIAQQVVLLDGSKITPDFFKNNFKIWDGGSIPFTLFRKGDKTDEYVGMMSKETLDEKIQSLLN